MKKRNTITTIFLGVASLFAATVFAETELELSISASALRCKSYKHEGFSVEGRGEGNKVYNCKNERFRYYHSMNIRKQQGLRCDDEFVSDHAVDLVCENRSRKERSVRRVTLTCCNQRAGE